MHIEFSRTGGFAGIRLAASVDTQDLPEEQASRLSQLVLEAGFFGLPEKLAPEKPVPDRFEYRLSIQDSEKSHSVVVSDAAAPDSLRPLLNYLTTLAMVRRSS